MFFENVNNLNDLKREYHKLVFVHHPDRGGDTATMQQINAEYDKLFERLKNNQNKQANAGVDGVKETTETPEEFKNIVDALLKIDGIEIELCGSWLWISGDTKPNKEALKAAGCKWSKSKAKWYWRHAENGCWYGRGRSSMEDIRDRYGSAYLVKNNQLQLA